MKKLIEFSVKNPLLVNLLSVFFVAAGLVSLSTMPREAFPNIAWDRVMIQTNYFGATPQEIEKLITIKIEDELKEVDGIDEILSISSENISLIVVQLDPDYHDKRKVVNQIQRAVDRAEDLPQDLEDDPLVTEIESRSRPVINVSLSGDLTERELQDEARALETRLLDIPGVAKVVRIGWREREMWVELDPEKVAAWRLSLEEVAEALRSHNLNVPGGTLDVPGEGEYLVRTMGEFQTAEEIREVVIRANDLGNWVRVKEVAEVKDTFEDDDILEKTLGTRAITLTVVKKETGDIIEVVNQIKAEAEKFKREAPEALRVSFFDDLSFYVKRRLNVLLNNGRIGLVLILLSLLLFLTRSVALMTALGLPLALAIAFLLMNAFGLTINLITMFAMIMVLGILVDDAIVISENVYRHIESGMPPKKAAIVGASQVAIPVTSTVLTSIAAFIPIFFMKGIIGKFVGVMPLVVIAALAGSLIESIFVLPSHLAEFVKPKKPPSRDSFKGKFNQGFRRFRIRYLKVLRWVVHHRYKALGVMMGIFLLAFLLFRFGMKFVLFPQGLIEEFFIRTEAAVGTSLEENERRMSEIEKFIKTLPPSELENFITQVGLQRENPNDPYTNRGSHVGQIQVFLTPERDRKRKADPIIAELREKAKSLEGLFDEITFEKVRAGPPVGKPVTIELRGDDLERLKKAALRFRAELAQVKGVLDPQDDFDLGKVELRVKIDHEAARKMGLTVRAIADTVRSAIDGKVATTIQKTDEEVDVLVRYPKEYRTTKAVFDRLFVPNRFGNLIALNKVAVLEEVVGYQVIKRLDRRRMIQVTADLDEKVITPVEVQRKMERLTREVIAKDFPDVVVTFGGEQEETRESLQDFYRAFILALALIFIILALNFNSLIQPLVVMLSIPFGLVGVVFAFFLHGIPFSFMALLGVIGLSGVVVNDSIVLVDFINDNRKRGWSRARSIFEAGRKRLRPVLLTSITTVVGLGPTAYGIGGSDPFVKPMALAIAWGLFAATALTLLIIPCVYTIFDDLRLRWEAFRERLKCALPAPAGR